MSNTTNGANGAFTESNVTSEVDRILNMVNVNAFIKGDTSQAPSANPNAPAVRGPGRMLETSQAPNPSAVAQPGIPAVTSTLAEFIASARPSLLNSTLREQLSECILDYLAVTAAGATLAPSSEPILKGTLAFNHNHTLPKGTGCTVITQGQTYPPHIAALFNATYGHSLDFDDTHAESSLHAGVTAISTALAEAECQLRRSQNQSAITSDDLLLSILLGYEITIRIGIALSTASYSRGFHNTSVAGIFGCAAVLSVLRRLPSSTIVNAFGLAGSKAAGSMQYLANGSHNKRLHAGFAAHDAFLCVSLAEAGVIGADAIIEGDLGLLQGYTDRDRADVDWDRLISNLGTKWEFQDSALKPYAGCRMTHGFVELADSLGKHIREGKFADKGVISNGTLDGIKKIRCIMPKANMILVGQKIPNKVHPENTVDAQFSAYYQVANAVVYGGTHDMAAYAPERLKDEQIRGLCDKVECVVDESMRGMSCRMDVFLQDEDGNTVEYVRRDVPEPLGERSHPFERQGVEKKFLGLMGQVYGQDSDRGRRVMERVEDLASKDGKADVKALMDLLAKGPDATAAQIQ
ncbi:hypothetical protein LTR05_000535 [Lithohypha guttulata]|uniref:MmgE/PrpD family protein n=1 Tax=Lithohypha guttulata TaxID=1690604 RepID=A0AAN7YJH0_9EURO|nr:hypothetical protein LTR05_000535 [Lithohypha guttulata]